MHSRPTSEHGNSVKIRNSGWIENQAPGIIWHPGIPVPLGFPQLKSSAAPGERAKTGSPGRARKAGVSVTEDADRERPEKGWDESVADCLLCGKWHGEGENPSGGLAHPLVGGFDDPKDQHVFSGSNYQPVMIAWDWLWFVLLSLWACSCCTPLWGTHANHMLTMCFPLSAFFREQLSASIAVANVVSLRNLVHVSIGRGQRSRKMRGNPIPWLKSWLLKFGFTKCAFFFHYFFSHNHNVIINPVLARILTSMKFPNISNQSLIIKKTRNRRLATGATSVWASRCLRRPRTAETAEEKPGIFDQKKGIYHGKTWEFPIKCGLLWINIYTYIYICYLIIWKLGLTPGIYWFLRIWAYVKTNKKIPMTL